MFSTNQSAFEEWAKLDSNYINQYDSIGIYQCYCLDLQNNQDLKTSETCREYKNQYNGGTSKLINIAIGAFIGVSNFIGTKIIGLVTPRLGCQNLQT